jgi:hypothetical protein
MRKMAIEKPSDHDIDLAGFRKIRIREEAV